jgi:hypothetical protein
MNQEPDPINETGGEQQVLPFGPPLEERAPAETITEIDRLRAENAELQLRLRQRDVREDLTAAMRSAGARSPELIFEAAKNALQFGEDGSLINAEAVVAQMKRKFPEQFGTASPLSIDGGAGRDISPNALTKDVLAKMKPDEIARLDWGVIKEALKQ